MTLNEKRSTFLATIFVCLCGAIGCTTHLRTQIRSETVETDTVRTVERTDTVGIVQAGQQWQRYTAGHSATSFGELSIDRDSAGRAIRYSWRSNGNLRSSGAGNIRSESASLGYHSGSVKDSIQTIQENTRVQEEKEQKAGTPLEKLIGIPILFFAIGYITVVLISQLFRNGSNH